MATRILVAGLDVIDTVAPYALALAGILAVVGLVVWVFNRWNREPPI